MFRYRRLLSHQRSIVILYDASRKSGLHRHLFQGIRLVAMVPDSKRFKNLETEVP